jgi:hypothetical protein
MSHTKKAPCPFCPGYIELASGCEPRHVEFGHVEFGFSPRCRLNVTHWRARLEIMMGAIERADNVAKIRERAATRARLSTIARLKRQRRRSPTKCREVWGMSR